MQVAYSNEVFQAPLVQRRTQTMLRFCRKMIYQEFGVKLAFTQEDLLEQINSYAKKSRDKNLMELAGMLTKELT